MMGTLTAVEIYQRYSALTRPLRNLNSVQPVEIQQLPAAARVAVASQQAASMIRAHGGLVEMATVAVGALTVMAARVTPMELTLKSDEQLTVALAYSGRALMELERRAIGLSPGEALVFANRGGRERIGFGTGIGFQLCPERLQRAMRAISGLDAFEPPSSGLFLHLSATSSAALHTVLALVDQLLLEDPLIPQMLGLDEQLYRLVAIQELKALGLIEVVKERAHHLQPSSRSKVIDRLLEYIENHLDAPLTLTELESHSGYCGRRLQQLFQASFGCTPMQYVRRRRLEQAHVRLEQAQPGDTITAISRSLGYRQVGHFTADFRKHYAHAPSDLLRVALGQASTP